MTQLMTMSSINSTDMICMIIDEKNIDVPEHSHEFIEIEYVLSGAGVQIVNGVEYRVERGDLLFFNIGDRHSYYPIDKIKIVNCIFSSDLLNSHFEASPSSHEKLLPSLVSFSGSDIVEIEKCINAMIFEYEKREFGHTIVLKSYLDILLIKIVRATKNKRDDEKKNMTGVLNYIETHYSQISCKDVASFCSYSSAYFSKMFKENLGINLTDYINTRRIHEASKLIMTTDYPIEHICSMVGYKDKKHFYRIFKKVTGSTPGAFRNK